MNQVVARGESLRRLARDAATMYCWSTNARRTKQLAVGDHRQPIDAALESAIEPTRQNRERAGLRIADQSLAHHRALATFGDQFGNARRLLRNDQHPRLVAAPCFEALGECARSPARHHRVVPAEAVVTIGTNQRGWIGAPGQCESLAAGRGECRDECATFRDRRWPPGRQQARRAQHIGALFGLTRECIGGLAQFARLIEHHQRVAHLVVGALRAQ